MPLLLSVPQDSSLEISLNNGGSIQSDPIDSDTLLGGSPLSAAFFVDQATATPAPDQNGSPGAPFGTLAAAVAANPTGGTFVLVPADYSLEVMPALASGNWSFWGLDLAQLDTASPPVGPPTVLPNLVIAGVAPSEIYLRSVRIASLEVNSPGLVALCDTYVNFCSSTSPGAEPSLRAQRSYFDSSGVGTFLEAMLDGCGFSGSQSLILAGSNCELTRCFGETSIVFSGPSGTVETDFYTRGLLTIPVLTNGAAVVAGFAPSGLFPPGTAAQSLTASLTDPQAQIDDIVLAGGNLGLWTDNRVP